MRITVYTIGKQKSGPYADLIQTYIKRIPISLKIVECNVKKTLEPLELKKAEASLLLANISQDCYTVALDERGENMSSLDFAQIITDQQARGTKEISFIIGGAYGLDQTVRQRADTILSFGRLVWPHQMVRLMLVEQIYRALMIQQGHPYHK